MKAGTVTRFIQHEQEISKTVPDGHPVFYNETKNFENCIQTAILFLTKKYKIWETVYKQTTVYFYNEMQNFENRTKTDIRFYTTKTQSLKTAPKGPFIFRTRNTKINYELSI